MSMPSPRLKRHWLSVSVSPGPEQRMPSRPLRRTLLAWIRPAPLVTPEKSDAMPCSPLSVQRFPRIAQPPVHVMPAPELATHLVDSIELLGVAGPVHLIPAGPSPPAKLLSTMVPWPLASMFRPFFALPIALFLAMPVGLGVVVLALSRLTCTPSPELPVHWLKTT